MPHLGVNMVIFIICVNRGVEIYYPHDVHVNMARDSALPFDGTFVPAAQKGVFQKAEREENRDAEEGEQH
ncbi:hypothetical protein M2A_1635 [Tepidicaulis marinus]|uniref:Uncharacterized protein n=1 Tax=Tepidicaulis marinus TaxID=1333998 RepID=A0A081BAR8_9HYPH|nr:hypothetical protein M2A_1635 [Tepidicaulis marinus]